MSSSDEKRPSVSQRSEQPVTTASGKVEERTANQMATMHDDDERLLAQIGYEQVGLFPGLGSCGHGVLTR